MPDARGRRLWRGLSVFDSAAGGRGAAHATSSLGRYIAQMEIRHDGAVEFEPTGRAGHYTVWGRPGDLVAMVVAVESV